MASNSSCASSTRTTVLRIKRKRAEDPFEVLLIHRHDNKKSKGDHKDEGEGFFKLACSVKATTTDTPDVQQALRNHVNSSLHIDSKDQTRLTRSNQISQIRDAIRIERREEQVAERFKVVANQRSITDTPVQDSSDASDLHILDVVRNPAIALPKPEPTDSVVMCNNVKMMRQTLTLDDDDSTEFIHDYYIANAPMDFSENQDFDVEPIAEDYWLDIIHYQKHNSELNQCEDEDDSNDESNWRNDYPDEGSSTDSSSESSNGDDLYRCRSSKQSRNSRAEEFDGRFDGDEDDLQQTSYRSANYYADDFYGNDD